MVLFCSEELSTLQDELDHTKATAHLMLLDQNSEISQALQTLSTLLQKVSVLDQNLQTRIAQWSQVTKDCVSLTSPQA